MPCHDAIDVNVARQTVATRIHDFINRPLSPYLPLWMALGGGHVSRRALARVCALEVTTGVGKTSTLVEIVAKRVKQLREWGDTRKIILLVPRHELGDATAASIRDRGVSATVMRGREADTRDPRFPDQEVCYDKTAVKAAHSVGQPVYSSCCKSDEHTCPFFDRCGYQARLKEDPDVWIATHEYLIQNPKLFGEIAFVFIDEGFWRAVVGSFNLLMGQLPNKGLAYGEIDGMSHSAMPIEQTKRQLVNALRDHPIPEDLAADGLIPVEQERLRGAGLTASACRNVAWSEQKTREHVRLYPGMPAGERARAIRSAGRTAAHVGNIVRVWEAAADLLQLADGSLSGRLFVRALDRTLHVQSGPNMHDGWREFPTMMLDATLPPRDLLNCYFPRHQIIDQGRGITAVAMPHARVRQIINASVSKRKLEIEGNRQALHRYIIQRWIETGRKETLVVTQKDASAWLADRLPQKIKVRHFNNLTGMNDGENVRLLIVAGRPMPPARSVELITGAIIGTMPVSARKAANGSKSYERSIREVGTYVVQDNRHPDPVGEIVRWLICEGEVMQAIGRARAVNRRSDNPVQIDILADLNLPLPIDEVRPWETVKVGKELSMVESGIVLTSPSDMAKGWPDAWKDTKAAENWLKSHTLPTLVYNHIQGEGGGVMSHWMPFQYQHAGPRQKRRNGFFDRVIVPHPRAWLEQRLGVELAGLEIGIDLAN